MKDAPRLAVALYGLCLPPGEDQELGDLIEEFHTSRLPTLGPRAARRWFWGQVARSALPSLFTPVARHGPVSTAIVIGAGCAGVLVVGRLATLLTNGLLDVTPQLGGGSALAVFLLLGFSFSLPIGWAVAHRATEVSRLTLLAISTFVVVPELTHVAVGRGPDALLPLLWMICIPSALVMGAYFTRLNGIGSRS